MNLIGWLKPLENLTLFVFRIPSLQFLFSSCIANWSRSLFVSLIRLAVFWKSAKNPSNKTIVHRILNLWLELSSLRDKRDEPEMRLSTASTTLLSVAAASKLALAAAVAPAESPKMQSEVARRAAPDSPSGGYAPKEVDCPSDRPGLREGTSLSRKEKNWLSKRDEKTRPALDSFLSRANIKDFDASSYFKDDKRPRIAISVSGGGYRALMNGAGFLAAADDRTEGSTDDSGIGGLLQAATYLSGLSGGGWLVGSLFANNWTSVQDVQRNGRLWQFQDTIINGPTFDDSFVKLDTFDYWSEIRDQVSAKVEAGYETSITDYWGRALSYQLVEDPLGAPAYTFSSIADADNFKNGDTPFPIVVADGRLPGTIIISLNTTVYEFNPFEMGSWDPTLRAFVPLRYLGSNFSDGVVPDSGSCVRGYDSLSYILGTSSSLFNIFLYTNLTDAVPGFIEQALTGIATSLNESNNDIAQYRPNPFLNWNPDLNTNAREEQLTLVDGGLDLQNIPLQPVLQPARSVDVIFAVDSSADTPTNWPNGTALRATYDRSRSPIADGVTFPPVPPALTFINKKLNQQPTFFGCSAANFSDGGSSSSSPPPPPPLVVYLPNAPYSAQSNVSTFTPSYELGQRDGIILNGYHVGTRGNGSLDEDWPACVGCAILKRWMEREGTEEPKICGECFERYCWDGQLDETEVVYNPELLMNGASGLLVGKWALGLASVGTLAMLL